MLFIGAGREGREDQWVADRGERQKEGGRLERWEQGGREAKRWCVGKRQGSTHSADKIAWVKSWNMTVSLLILHFFPSASFFFSACLVQSLNCVCVSVTGGIFDTHTHTDSSHHLFFLYCCSFTRGCVCHLWAGCSIGLKLLAYMIRTISQPAHNVFIKTSQFLFMNHAHESVFVWAEPLWLFRVLPII